LSSLFYKKMLLCFGFIVLLDECTPTVAPYSYRRRNSRNNLSTMRLLTRRPLYTETAPSSAHEGAGARIQPQGLYEFVLSSLFHKKMLLCFGFIVLLDECTPTVAPYSYRRRNS
jgi:hypothetical protein